MNTPRFTGLPNKDNTDRIIKRGYIAPAYAATFTLAALGYSPQNAYHLVDLALTGNATITAPVGSTTTPPMVGDVLEFLFTPDATTRTVTLDATFAATAATIVVTASKFGAATFVFNGTVWQEKSRAVTV